MAHLIALGVGDSESIQFWNTHLLLRTDAGNLLIDCGYTIKYALAEHALGLPDINAVFVSHVHGDHVFGLERIGFESRYVYNQRARLYLEPELRIPLWDQCLKGSMGYSSSGRNTLESFFDVEEISGHAFEFGGVRMRTFHTRHTVGKPSFGIVFNDSLIFTSDTNVLPWIARDRTSRPIWHDCSFVDTHPAHATVHEMIEAYPESVRRRIRIIHYGDDVDLYREEIESSLGGIVSQGSAHEL
jgi:ribonuclease BN (tRNA processing enzyme)